MKKNPKPFFLFTAFFAAYMFQYMVTLTYIDKKITSLASPSTARWVHYFDLILVGIGYLSLVLLRRFFRSEKERRFLPFLPDLLYLVSLICVFMLQAPALYAAAALVTSYFLGLKGAAVYYLMSRSLSDSPYMGKSMGIGASFAVILQYVLQEMPDLPQEILLLLLCAFGILNLPVYRNARTAPTTDNAARDPKTAPVPTHTSSDILSDDSHSMRKSLIFLSLTVILMNTVLSFYDGQIVWRNIQSGYEEGSLYSWPRLFSVIGYLAVGFIGDIRSRKYVPITALCINVTAVIMPLLSGFGGNYTLNMCIFYLCLGTEVAYLNLMFWHEAPRTKLPQLWAGMGRVLDIFWSSILLFVRYETIPLLAITCISLLMFMLLIVCMAADGRLFLSRDSLTPADKASVLKNPAGLLMQNPKLYAEHYHLTPRETDILEQLLTTEKDLQEIADSLYVSRRVVQRHITSIYEKTQTKSRIGLIQSYLTEFPS